MEKLQRIRYVTQHFEELQGYRLLPFAAFYLVGAVYDATLPLLLAYASAPAAVVAAAVTMFLSFIVCAIVSHRIGQSYTRRYGLVRRHAKGIREEIRRKEGWWWVAVEPQRWADRVPLRAVSFSAETWWLLGATGVLLGFHKPLLGLLGAYLVWKLTTQGPLPMRQVPHAVLYLALASHFPGIDSGILGGPSAPGLNAYVITDLVWAALLVGVALNNHQVLTRALGTRKVQDELRG